MTVVLDTSVWISALEFGGVPRLALEKALAQDRLAVSDYIVDEVIRVLTTKFGHDSPKVHARLLTLVRNCLYYKTTELVRNVCRDPSDDAILECVLKSNAQTLVSGDRDLLVLERFASARIITARAYVSRPAK